MGSGPSRFEHFLEPSLEQTVMPGVGEYPHSAEIAFAALSVLVAAAGIYLAFRMYIVRPGAADALAGRAARLYRLLFNKYYVDQAYDALFVTPMVTSSKEILWKTVDVQLIDGAVNGVGRMVRAQAWLLKNIQNGLVRGYAAWILAGAAAVLFYMTFMRG
jgi:NADH-quinone oxidoreductase subunit L